MKDIDKLERHEAEQLIAACKLRIESIDENKKQKDRLERKNKPLKTRIKDLEEGDVIYSIEEYPSTPEFDKGYRVLKCYVLSISHLSNNGKDYLSISIDHESQPRGRYGIIVHTEDQERHYIFDSLNSFFTLSPHTWKEDYNEGVKCLIENDNKLHQQLINRKKKYSENFLNDNGVVATLLEKESYK